MFSNSSGRKLKKKRSPTPSTSVPIQGESTFTATARDSYTTEDALRGASTALEALKNVGDAAGVLGPLKAICGVLKIVVDTAVLLKNNGEDLRDLDDKLEYHQHFLEAEIAKLSQPEYSKSSNVEEITRPLQDYFSHLQRLNNQLETLKGRYDETSKRKRVKMALNAQSDQAELVDCTKKLEDSFRQFTNAMTIFIARQTVLLRNEMAILHESMAEMSARLAEKDANDALSRLAYADARGNQHDTCMKGTREALLENISSWVANITPIFALVDQAGTGKSTIAAHMTRQWEKKGLLLARYFFSKPSTVTGKDLASTLAREIAENAPLLRPIILDALNKHPNFTACSIREQLEWIVFTPLKSLETTKILVVDALDECSKDDRGVFLKHLFDFISSYPTGSCPLKLFLTARPEDDIVSRLCEPRYATLIHGASFELRPKEHPSNEADIRLYAIALLSNILTNNQINLFVTGSKGLFIWASTAYIYLKDALDPVARFENLMNKGMTLDSLYGEIISSAVERVGDQQAVLVKVLQAICVALEPFTVDMVDELLGLHSGVAARVVTMLSSVLSDGDQGKPVHVLHPTFLEYLLNPQACQLAISHQDAEALVAKGCLSVCSNRLKYDICDIHHRPQYPPVNREIKKLEMLLRERTTPALRYAAINVLSHVGSSLYDTEVVDGLRRLFDSKLLNWIELMSLYGKIYSFIQSIQHLKIRIDQSLELPTTCMTPNDLVWCSQIWGMMQAFQGVIEESAMQVYFSALPFEPPESRIACRYLPQFAGSIPRVTRGARNSQSQSMVLCGHIRVVTCIAYAPSGHVFASGSRDQTIRLWDPVTSAAIAELTGHTDWVTCLEFSVDGKLLASGSNDGTVRLWDPSAGITITTLAGQIGSVTCLAFSPREEVLASGYEDGMVRLWDLITGASIADFIGHTGRINCLEFSPDDEVLASGSDDGTVRLWNPNIAAAVVTMVGHTHRVACLTFSPDGKVLASGSNDTTVRLWDPNTGTPIAKLTGHTHWVNCLAYSPSGKMIASGSYDETVRLWNPTTGTAVAELTGHEDEINCLRFSPDGKKLASGSTDNTVRLWDANTGGVVGELTGHTGSVTCLAYSPDSTTVASGSYDYAVRLWNSTTNVAVAELTGHTGPVNCLAFSPGSKLLASGSDDNTVQLWDTKTGAAVVELIGHSNSVACLSFSPDGQMLASGSDDNTVQIWDPATGVGVAELIGHTNSVQCIEFSPDSRMLASGSSDATVRLWDPVRGKEVAELTGHVASVSCLAFSPDGGVLGSGSFDKVARIWYSSTGQAIGDSLLHEHDVEYLELHSRGSDLFLTVGDWHNTKTLWYLSPTPPSHRSGEGMLGPSPPPTSFPIQFNYQTEYTKISTAGITFQLPPYFPSREFCSNEGIAAYGGRDGSVIIVDCTHLV